MMSDPSHLRALTEKRILSATASHTALTTSLKATTWSLHALSDSRRTLASLTCQLRAAETEALRYAMKRTRRASANDVQKANKPSGSLRWLVDRVARRPSASQCAEVSAASRAADADFLGLLQGERAVGLRIEALKREVFDAKVLVEQHEIVAAEHEVKQGQLDDLYDLVFGGAESTSGFSNEETARCVFRKAQIVVGRLEMDVENENQALKLLHDANGQVALATREVKNAMRWNKVADTPLPFALGTKIVGDAGEKNALSNTRDNLSQAKSILDDAKDMQPLVNGLSSADVARFFDADDAENPFFGGKTGQRIEESFNQVIKVQRHVYAELEAGKMRKKNLTGELRNAKKQMEITKLSLRTTRMKKFREVVGDVDSLSEGAPSVISQETLPEDEGVAVDERDEDILQCRDGLPAYST